jgi:hypothetical protein
MGLINDCAMKKYGECEVYLETFLGTRMKWCFGFSTHWNESLGGTQSQSGCYSVPLHNHYKQSYSDSPAVDNVQ